MASPPPPPPLFASAVAKMVAFLLVFASAAVNGQKSDSAFEMGPEKQTHMHFFFHDIVSGQNPTAIKVASAPSTTVRSVTNTTSSNFGGLVMIDDPLTTSSDPTSKPVGRAQGLYVTASMEGPASLMTMNLHFTDGEFKDSTLAVVGRVSVMEKEWELPVVGGTGKLRWAQGYASGKVESYDAVTGNSVVEYDVYMTHGSNSHTAVSGSGSGSVSPVGSGVGSTLVKVGLRFGFVIMLLAGFDFNI